MLFLLFACGGEVSEEPTLLHDPDLIALEAPRLLRRMSLDLRGVLPSLKELDEVEADPSRLEDIWPTYLDESSFEERLVEVFSEQWLTRVDEFNVGVEDYQLPSNQEFDFAQSVGEEPLRILAHIATMDRAWTDVVTWDGTMANPLLESIWPLKRSEGEGWQPAQWLDQRPAAGVLSSNGLWWRYYTTPFNFNRTRAAALSKLLLCEDYLERPVRLSAAPSLLDEDGTEESIRNEDGCKSCHSTLDPIASALYGFWWYEIYDPAELSQYHPDREPMGEMDLGVKPAFFGKPVQGLAELGRVMSEDPRLVQCAVEQSFVAFMRRDPTLTDFPRLKRLQRAFEEGELRHKALMEALLREPAYRAGAFAAEASEDAQDRERLDRMLSPAQLARSLEELTGFRWTENHWDQLKNDRYGHRVLAGGVDGDGVDRPASSPSVSQALVLKRLAQSAAHHVVQRDLVDGAEGGLLKLAWLDSASEDVLKAALSEVHWRLLGRRVSSEEAEALLAFFWTVEAESDELGAWQSVVTVLLRDPEFVSY